MATIIIPNFNTQKTLIGLNTYQYTIPADTAAGTIVTARMEVSHKQGSQLTASIVQAGSISATLATKTAQPTVTPNTTAQNMTIVIAKTTCSPGDTISFAVTSSATPDLELNTVSTNMTVNIGAVT